MVIAFFAGLLKQWQEILQMIVSRLQLSEAYGKIMVEAEDMENKLEKVILPQENLQQLFHSKEDLENHIEKLKVSQSRTLRLYLTESKAGKSRNLHNESQRLSLPRCTLLTFIEANKINERTEAKSCF